MESEAEHPATPAQPVLDYQDPRSEDAAGGRRAWAELLHGLAAVVPGCLLVAAVLVIMLVYAMIAIAVLFRDF